MPKAKAPIQRIMRKKVLIVLFFVGFVAIVTYAWIHAKYASFLDFRLHVGTEGRLVEIPRGASASTVAKILDREGILGSWGVVKGEWMMRYCLRDSGLSRQIQPGTLMLTSSMRVRDIPGALARVGAFARRTVSISRGMNLYEIADRLQAGQIADRKTFLALATDPAFAVEAGIPAQSFEGYLAAGSYEFEAGITSADVLTQMHGRWRTTWDAMVAEMRGPHEQALRRVGSDHAIVTLASIVDKEAVHDDERPVIARVFYNRLGKKMKLQSDPTCVYPPEVPREKPTPARCRQNAAYSTYVLPGLPPGPIANPSAAALRAVMQPYDGPDASAILYFVARNDGSNRHYFSKTYAEHQVAVDYFLKGKKAKKPRGTTQPK